MNPRESCEYIAKNAEHVTIVTEKIDNIAALIAGELAETADLAEFCKSKWTHPLRPVVLDESALSRIFLCATWNYCFWPNPWEESFGVTYSNKTPFFLTGSKLVPNLTP